jgi:hypothetical protein
MPQDLSSLLTLRFLVSECGAGDESEPLLQGLRDLAEPFFSIAGVTRLVTSESSSLVGSRGIRGGKDAVDQPIHPTTSDQEHGPVLQGSLGSRGWEERLDLATVDLLAGASTD